MLCGLKAITASIQEEDKGGMVQRVDAKSFKVLPQLPQDICTDVLLICN